MVATESRSVAFRLLHVIAQLLPSAVVLGPRAGDRLSPQNCEYGHIGRGALISYEKRLHKIASVPQDSSYEVTQRASDRVWCVNSRCSVGIAWNDKYHSD